MIRRLRIKFVCINMVLVTAMLWAILAVVLHSTQAGMASESMRAMEAAVLPGPQRPAGPGWGPRCFTLELGPGGELSASPGADSFGGEAWLRQVWEAVRGQREGLLEEEGLIRRRQGSGSYATGLLPGSPPRQIAVVTSFLDDYIFPAILHDASDVFSRQGYSTTVYATENQVSMERGILLRLLEEPMGGLLVEGTKTALPTPNEDLYRRLCQAGTPIVFLHGAYAGLERIPCVADDNYGGGYQLARYLASRGHREFAGIFKSDDAQGPQRYHGALAAVRDEGLPIRDRRFAWYDSEDRRRLLEEKDGRVLTDFLQNRLGDATAVICYNDEIAFHLVQVLLAAGRRVPEEVAVVSFDNSYLSQISPVPITSLSHRSRMGRVAAEQMTALLRGEAAHSRFLEWELVVRSSG